MSFSPRATDFRAAFGPAAGVLPDGLVEGSGRSDWASVLQAIAGEGLVATWIEGRSAVTLDDLSNPVHAIAAFAVRPSAEVQVNFFLGDDVAFDLDLRELLNQDAVDAVCALIARIGVACGKRVSLTPEGENSTRAVVRFDPTSGDFTFPHLG